jgi:hypothetical protein
MVVSWRGFGMSVSFPGEGGATETLLGSHVRGAAMGYACPVCETPHPDGEHLANHLAFTALLGRTDHEAWLEDHVPDWAEMGPEELALRVVTDVPETEFPQVFDDTSDGHAHESGNHAPTLEDHLAEGGNARGYGRGDPTDDAEDVMAEARRMTAEMLDDEADGDDAAGNDGAAGDNGEE